MLESFSTSSSAFTTASRELLGLLRREQRHFQLAADSRERGAQLVRHVGRKLADLIEGAAQPRSHAVEAINQVIQLVVGIAPWNAQREFRAGNFLAVAATRLSGRIARPASAQPSRPVTKMAPGKTSQ